MSHESPPHLSTGANNATNVPYRHYSSTAKSVLYTNTKHNTLHHLGDMVFFSWKFDNKEMYQFHKKKPWQFGLASWVEGEGEFRVVPAT